MKNFLRGSLLVFIVLYGIACKKTNDLQQPLPGMASASIDTTSPRVKALTRDIWYYYEYYNDANVAATKLVWKAGKTNVNLNLSLNHVRYYTDGTYTETDQYGTVINGTWELINNETQIRVYNNVGIGVYTSDIKVLNNDVYEWHFANNGATYGIMRHSTPGFDSANAVALLTAGEWKYESYFTDFNAASANLVWKIGKSNSLSPMNNLLVKYNANGTYWEYDQNGNYYPGTWTLNGNILTVYNNVGVGVYSSILKVLTADRLEWNSYTTDSSNGYYYGEMVH